MASEVQEVELPEGVEQLMFGLYNIADELQEKSRQGRFSIPPDSHIWSDLTWLTSFYKQYTEPSSTIEKLAVPGLMEACRYKLQLL